MKNFSWPRLGKFIALGMLSLFLTLVVLGGLVFAYFAITSPTLSEEELIATASSKIYDNQNNLIADLGSEKRENASPEEIPVELVNAIVAIEDHRFFDHRGLDSAGSKKVSCNVEKCKRAKQIPSCSSTCRM